MKFFYYPGCSLEATAKDYDHSARVVCRSLGIELVESKDWCCCGSTSAHSLDRLLSLALPARNIALAQEAGSDLITPCAACFNRLKRADRLLSENEKIRREVEAVVEFRYTGAVKIFSLLEAIVNIYGLEQIAARIKKPLNGLQVVCYYGCLLVRPPEVTNFDRPENPLVMDNLMTALGAEVKMWSYKTECCGAYQGVVNSKFTARLVNTLLAAATEAGAQALVTSCPLCQANLEMRRNSSFTLPSFYFTELMAIALGSPVQKIWLNKHLVDPLPLLRSLSLAG